MNTLVNTVMPIPFIKKIFITILVIIALFFTATKNYLLFHSLTEGFAILVAGLIYVLARQTYKYSHNNYLLFIGTAYFYIGIFDFFHVITSHGMGIFNYSSPNVSTQIWVAGRVLEAVSLVIAPFFVERAFSLKNLFRIYSFIAAFLFFTIMIFPVFPVCFNSAGLTLFKIIAEYVIISILLCSIWHLYRRHGDIDERIVKTITYAILATVFSELSFTLYTNVSDTTNFVGHLFKIVSYYLIYHGVVLQGLRAPFEFIFRDLKETSITDYLTGLYNRQGFMELARKELDSCFKEKRSLIILMMDLDNFKKINDRFGHDKGDQVLKQFADILREKLPHGSLIFRLGGDEFSAIIELHPAKIEELYLKLQTAMKDWREADPAVFCLGLSIGSALGGTGGYEEMHELLKKADQRMYRMKGLSKAKYQEENCIDSEGC